MNETVVCRSLNNERIPSAANFRGGSVRSAVTFRVTSLCVTRTDATREIRGDHGGAGGILSFPRVTSRSATISRGHARATITRPRFRLRGGAGPSLEPGAVTRERQQLSPARR